MHDAHGARTRGALFLGDFFLGKQKEVTRPSGRNAFDLTSDKRQARSKKQKAKGEERMDARPARMQGASFLLLLLGTQKEVTRPSGRSALALEATSDGQQARSKDRGQSPLPQQQINSNSSSDNNNDRDKQTRRARRSPALQAVHTPRLHRSPGAWPVSNANVAHREFLGHPVGLYVCFMTEMWERFSFYGMKALLLLYLTKYHLFSDGEGAVLTGTYAGLAYALPLFGGVIADRWLGMRKAVLFGGILLVVGQFGMAWTGTSATGAVGAATRDALAIQVMYFSLAFIIVGVGFLKPNISTIVGRLYPDGDPRRESGFTIFYMGINIGAALASLIVAYVGEIYGWHYGFSIAGFMMAAGLVQFAWGQKHLMGKAEPPDAQRLSQPVWGIPTQALIYIGGLLTTAVVWQVLQTKIDLDWLTRLASGHEVTLSEVVAVTMGTGLLIWFLFFLFSGITALQRGKMVVLMALIVVSALFWGIYEQSYITWVTFADRAMNREMLGFNLTAGQTTSFTAIFVILFSPFFAWLWPRLDKAGWNPSLGAKFGWALIFVGLGTGLLGWAAGNSGGAPISVWWMVGASAVLVVGEMMLSPIGLSAVTSLSVPRVVGTMMGAWFLASAFGEMLAGRFGTWASINPGTDGSFDVANALTVYADAFTKLMWIGAAAGAVMLVLSPVMKRASGGAR